MKKLKYVKTYEVFESHESELGNSKLISQQYFSEIIPKTKIDKDFEIKAESIANLIIYSPELSVLKELALNITDFGPYEAGHGSPKEYFSELKRCFPSLNLKSKQLVNTGTKIPFYGRTKNSAGGFITGHPVDISLPLYIAQKVQNPGYKY